MTTYIGPHSTLPRSESIRTGRSSGAAAQAQRQRREVPEVGPPIISIANVTAWLAAEAMTKLRGNVPLPVIEARTMACVSGGADGGPCPLLRQKHSRPDPIGYCGGCGCGDREEGRLSRKVTMRGLKLPNGCIWSE